MKEYEQDVSTTVLKTLADGWLLVSIKRACGSSKWSVRLEQPSTKIQTAPAFGPTVEAALERFYKDLRKYSSTLLYGAQSLRLHARAVAESRIFEEV